MMLYYEGWILLESLYSKAYASFASNKLLISVLSIFISFADFCDFFQFTISPENTNKQKIKM